MTRKSGSKKVTKKSGTKKRPARKKVEHNGVTFGVDIRVSVLIPNPDNKHGVIMARSSGLLTAHVQNPFDNEEVAAVLASVLHSTALWMPGVMMAAEDNEIVEVERDDGCECYGTGDRR